LGWVRRQRVKPEATRGDAPSSQSHQGRRLDDLRTDRTGPQGACGLGLSRFALSRAVPRATVET